MNIECVTNVQAISNYIIDVVLLMILLVLKDSY